MADNINDKDYLQEWKETFSEIGPLTGNGYLEREDILLQGSAEGTPGRAHLDPQPFTNKIGEQYTHFLSMPDTIIAYIQKYIKQYKPARTDSIRMNRENMDYTLHTENEEEKGLNLLMPQYQRRVEVEDLDENFWVISLALDAVLQALWGDYGIVGVIRRLIIKILAIERFLGLNNIVDIELMHGDSNDLYFDMYSRFNLNELAIKLKTNSGERIIKDFISPTNEVIDRSGSTTDAYTTRGSLFQEINKLINSEGQGNRLNKLYDSDLISIEQPIELTRNGKEDNYYLSLGTVLDFINERVEKNSLLQESYNFATIKYSEGSVFDNMLAKVDGGDNGLTLSEIAKMAEDLAKPDVKNFSDLGKYKKYQDIYEYVSNLELESKERNALARLWIETFKLDINPDDPKDATKFKNLKNSLQDLFITPTKISIKPTAEDYDNMSELPTKQLLEYGNIERDKIADFLDFTFKVPLPSGPNISNGFVSIDDNHEIDGALKPGNKDYKMKLAYQGNPEVSNAFDSLVILKKEIDKLNLIFPKTKNDSKTYYHIRREGKKDENGDFVYDKLLIAKSSDEEIADIIGIGHINDFYIAIPDEYIDEVNTEYLSSSVIYRGTLNYAIAISKSMLPSNGDHDVRDYYYEEDYDKKTDRTIFDEFFDVNEKQGDGEWIDLQDAIIIAKGLLSKDIHKEGYDKVTAIKQKFVNKNFLLRKVYDGNKAGEKVRGANFFYQLCELYSKGSTSSTSSEDSVNSPKRIMEILYSWGEKKDAEIPEKEIEEVLRRISNLFFEPVGVDPLREVLFDTIVYKPSLKFLIFLTKLGGSANNPIPGGFEITTLQKEDIMNSIKEYEYGLFGNIVIFLYDKNYYTFGAGYYSNGNTLVDDVGLIVNDQDSFYESEWSEDMLSLVESAVGITKSKLLLPTKKLIEGNEKGTEKILPLFLGREDLVNGEVIQLRLTQKDNKLNGFGDDNVFPYQVNFEKLIDNINQIKQDLKSLNKKITKLKQSMPYNATEDEIAELETLKREKAGIEGKLFKEIIKKDVKYSKTFLSLHNCFAENIGQYNFRTTLFFKDTTPFTEDDQKEKPKSLSDWFRNGISCTYFKPVEKIKQGEKTWTAICKPENLQIHASMIAKNEPYNDNSFVSEITQLAEDQFEGPYNRKYLFTKECAYFAATRHNLVFYASPPQNEFGQFVHSPGRFICSQKVSPNFDSIQSPKVRTVNTKGEKWYNLDVMGAVNNTCDLNDIKDMLYRNAHENRPLCVDAVFGRRDVDDYVKKKELDYIVVEREKGVRHQTYGPTTVGISISNGFLHSQDGLKSVYELPHKQGKITWYDKSGTETDNINITVDDEKYENFPSSNGVYGLVNLKGKFSSLADTFMIRFYSSAEPGDSDKQYSTAKEYLIPTTNGPQPWRRPIFTTAYFFGIDGPGMQPETKEGDK